MCILFLYMAKHSSAQFKKNGYKVILAANRDEFYSRPSRPASYWESDPNILGGQDLQSGGTWLGMNVKTGKIAALLNIRGGTDPTKQKISRGALVTNFLQSTPDLMGWTYCKNLNQDPSFDIREDFDQFNILTIDLLNNTGTKICDNNAEKQKKIPPLATYFTNSSAQGVESGPVNCDSKIISLGNQVLGNPYRKVSEGAKLFENIVSEKDYNSENPEEKIELKLKLLQLMKSKHRFPDRQLEASIEIQEQGQEENRAAEIASCICLHIPEFNYGTRTHTLILIDSDNNVDFHEWRKKNPIDSFKDPVWIESNFKFNLN